MKPVSLALTLLVLATAAGAQEYGSDHGRIRFADPGVTLQRGSDTGAEEASRNAPFLPGDRVWTDGLGRAQFQFRDGSVLSLDSRSKLDYITDDEGGKEDVVALRLWSGSLILHVRDGRSSPRFEVETPGGLVTVDDRGAYRIDAEPGETRLAVYDGQAVLDASRRRVVVEEGQTIVVRRGEWPDTARAFDRDRLDDFGGWDREQADLYNEDGQGRSARYLPQEVAPYASDFENNGTWHYETEVGYVWAPRVEAGWRPYSNGRWSWTAYGWNWVPYERWGFAPSHFGRWGFSAGLGWYWIPGAVWSPAWVSWAVGGDYVGWCPLGHRDRPVAGFDRALTRGSLAPGALRGPEWSFARRGDMASRDLSRRRLDAGAVEAGTLRVAESPRGRPTRDLRGLETAHAGTRTGYERPGPRDTVPEVRTDPYTTIPVPQARRRDGEAERAAREERGATTRSGRDRTSEAPSRWDWPEGASSRRAPAEGRSGESRNPEPRATVEPRSGSERSRGEAEPRATRERERTSERGEKPSRNGEGDHDVIRQLFKPLSEPRSAAPRDSGEGRSRPRAERPESSGGSSGSSGAPRGGSAPRAEAPPRTESRPPASARPQGGDAERRKPPTDKH